MSTDVVPDSQPPAEAWASTLDDGSPRSPKHRWLILGVFGIGLVLIAALAVSMMLRTARGRRSEQHMTYTVTRGDLTVTVTEQGTLESSDNTEIKCKVRGFSTIIWVVDSGTVVQPGDELVRLDTKVIEETVSLGKTNTHIARATLEKSKAEVAKAEIAVKAYLDGPYRARMKALEKELIIANAHLGTAEKMLAQSRKLFNKGYITELEVEGNAYTVEQAKLEVQVKQTQLDVLEQYTKAMELEMLNGNLIASKSKLMADEAGLAMETSSRDRALRELEDCVVIADRPGLVIYPSAAAWKNTPDIAEGATVRKDQVLLLMPDLAKMQVKVGIHESIIDRMRPGLKATVTLPDRVLTAEVTSVASVTRPAGWWTGNVVKYDTTIKLPSEAGLKPGMTAEVKIVLAEHHDVLAVPVASLVEKDEAYFCWVVSSNGPVQRQVKLGDGNDVYTIVEDGLHEGDQVVLNPRALDDESRDTRRSDVSDGDHTEAAHGN